MCAYDVSSVGQWNRTNGTAVDEAGTAGPAYDHTLRASGVGGFLLAIKNDSKALGPMLAPVFRSESCHLTFAYNINGTSASLSLGWRTMDDEEEPAADLIANSTFGTSRRWSRHRVPIPIVDKNNIALQIPVFTAKVDPGGSDYVAIDDITVTCGAPNATTGQCVCRDGFQDRGTSDTMMCEQIEDEITDDLVDIVGTCPERADCRLKQECLYGAKDVVCATGTVYRNRACATCNYEIDSTIFNGYCPSVVNDDIVGKCNEIGIAADLSARQNYSIEMCSNSDESNDATVCWDHVNYRNIHCTLHDETTYQCHSYLLHVVADCNYMFCTE